MAKRLIDLEDSLLEEARTALGTDTIKDTVTLALREAVLVRRRARLSEDDLVYFAEATADLRNPQVMAAAWR